MKRTTAVLASVIVFMSFASFVHAAEPNPVQLSVFNPLQLFDAGTSVRGVRLNLIYTVNQDVTGVDWGFVNVTNGDFLGYNVGFVNIVRGKATGFQKGFVNNTGNMSGLQLGFVNITDSLSGLQIGLINVNKAGPLVVFPIVNFSFN